MKKTMADPSETQAPQQEMKPLAPSSDALVHRQWTVDQVWSHFSDQGEEWVCCRLSGLRPSTEMTPPPVHGRRSRLLAAAKVSLVIADQT